MDFNETKIRKWCHSFANAWIWFVCGCYLGFGFSIEYFDISVTWADPIRLVIVAGAPLMAMFLPKALFEVIFGVVDCRRKRRAFKHQQML